MDNRIFLERYRLSRGRNGLPVELYRSPSARTYRAQEIETGREVALTLVSPAPQDPALLEQLETEALAAEQINQVNIPRLYDFGRENDELVYVTEYCEGHTAAAWVGARGPLSVGPVLRVALQTVDAMNATAFQRLHHSALNPDNIIFIAGQTVEGDWPPIKILQWFAPAPDLSASGDERIDSALRFASPEQVQHGGADVRSEIYSLGATMWFLLTGVPPAPTVAGEMALSGAEKLRWVPKIVRHLLDRMLRVDPAERPHDPVALTAYLQTCLARVERREKIERRFGVPLLAKTRVALAKPRMPIPIKPLTWAAGILALAALAILFLPWPLAHKRSAAVTEESAPPANTLPNEVAVVEKDSLGRMSETGLVAAALAPALVPSQESADEIPRNEMASTVPSNAPTGEQVPPGEGPEEEVSTPSPALVENSPAPQPPETILPEVESSDGNSVSQPVMAEANEPHEASLVANSPEPTPLNEEEAPPAPSPKEEPVKVAEKSAAPTKKVARSSPASEANKKRTVASTSGRSTTHSAKSRRASTAKRAKPLPKLRVGSSSAELVGTTSDGRWILSVSQSGKRIIVPPPPGFGE
ncbi:MAG: protein kinase [Chthoniobacterales bacterium]